MQRQRRTRPAEPAPFMSDVPFTQCTICLEAFASRGILWRLQCGHQFHKECWERNARSHATNQIKIAALGGIEALLKAMGEHPTHAEVQACTCWAMCNLTGNDANRR